MVSRENLPIKLMTQNIPSDILRRVDSSIRSIQNPSVPRSTKSQLRADIQLMKERHLQMNLNKRHQDSAARLQTLSQAGDQDDTASVTPSERYDLKAYAFNQYFPEGKREPSHEEWLEKERKKLGLGHHKEKMTVEERDAEPRYEISKLSALAKEDLEQTNKLCYGAVEKFYGDGKVLGDDIIENTRSASQLEGIMAL